LKAILGHNALYMAQVYVNLVAQDVLSTMYAAAPEVPVIQVPPPATGSADEILRERRSTLMANAVRNRLQNKAVPPTDAPVVAHAPVRTPSGTAAKTAEPPVKMPVGPMEATERFAETHPGIRACKLSSRRDNEVSERFLQWPSPGVPDETPANRRGQSGRERLPNLLSLRPSALY
jgi:hypothetical protein